MDSKHLSHDWKISTKQKLIPSETNLENAIWKSYLVGKLVTASELLLALQVAGEISCTVGNFFTSYAYDTLLPPTIETEPFKLVELNSDNSSIQNAKHWANQSSDYVFHLQTYLT